MKEDLDDLLRLWRPDVVESPTFKREVWRRIQRSRGPHQRFERFFQWLARPRAASLAAALAILGGVLVGSVVAGHKGQRAYLHDVDPYAQVALK